MNKILVKSGVVGNEMLLSTFNLRQEIKDLLTLMFDKVRMMV